MAKLELVELNKPIEGLLESGFIHPSKAPYNVPVLFQCKHESHLLLYMDYKVLNKVPLGTSITFLLLLTCLIS